MFLNAHQYSDIFSGRPKASPPSQLAGRYSLQHTILQSVSPDNNVSRIVNFQEFISC